MSTVLKTLLLIFSELIGWLFPLSGDEKQIREISTNEFSKKLMVRKQNDVTVLSHFSDPDVRATIHLVKFHNHFKARQLAGSLLASWLAAHVTEKTIIIPIPLSSQRYRERGYNQTELIARVAADQVTNVRVRTDYLIRHRHTPPQTSLKKAERINNVVSAFKVTDEAVSLKGKHLILFDDVMTTGATLKAAQAALLPTDPASLTCIALAH